MKQISAFTGRLSTVPQPAAPSVDEAKEQLALAMDGYDHDVETALKNYLGSASVADASLNFAVLLNKFLAVETLFDGKDQAEVRTN